MHFKKLFVAIFCLLSFDAFALSEANYQADYNKFIIPLISSFEYDSFTGVNGVKIHYATYTSNPETSRCLVILPGRSEPLEKYAEVVHSLNSGKLQNSFKYFLMDHRGQGSSGRMISDDGQKGHVDDFENYTKDFNTFMNVVVAQAHCGETFLLAHSLGAGIAIDFLEKNQQFFDRAAFSSPMLKIQTEPYSYALARSIVLANMAAGRGKKYAIGQKPFSGVRNFEANTFTSSPARYDMAMNMFDMIPEAKLGGVTNGWLNEVMKSTKKIRAHYADIKIPMHMFHAGIENYSDKDEMIRFCEEAPYCNRTYLETSKHEVLMDRDVNRDVVISELENFFN